MPLLNSMGVLRNMTVGLSSANQLWFSAYGNNIPMDLFGFKVLGNYIYGYGFSGVSGTRPYVIKIHALTGNIIWYKIFDGLTGQVRDVQIDSSNNVYLSVVNSTFSVSIIKLNSSGAFVSGRRYAGDGPDYRTNIVVDPNNNFIYVAHNNSAGTIGVLIQIDTTTMTTVWKKRVQPPSGSIVTRDLAIDSLGNVYVCYNSGRLVKFNSSGSVVWSNTKTGTAANQIVMHNDVLYCYTGNSASATNIVSVDTTTGSCIASLASTSFTYIQGVTINTDGNICVLYQTASATSTNKLSMTTGGTVLSNINFSGTTSTLLLGNSTVDYNKNLASDYSFTYVLCYLNYSPTLAYYGILKLDNDGNSLLNTPYSFVVNGQGTLAGNIVSASSSFPTITTPTAPTVTSITMTISTSISTETVPADSTAPDVPGQYIVPLI